MKIVLIAPYQNLVHDAREVCRTYGEQIEIVTGRMQRGVELAQRAVREDAGVLISRGGTFYRISEAMSIPTVAIAVTPYDVLRALQKAQNIGTKFAIVGFENVIGSMREWRDLLTVPVDPIIIEKSDSNEVMMKKIRSVIRKDQVDCILGDASVIEIADNMGVPAVLIESGKESIWSAIQEAKRILLARLSERKTQATLRGALDKANLGLIFVQQEEVQFANRLVLDLIGRDSCVGLPICDCLPQTLCTWIREGTESRLTDVIQISGRLWTVDLLALPGPGEYLLTFQHVEDIESMERRVRQKKSLFGHEARYTFDDLVGKSEKIRTLKRRAQRFAATDSSVLIVGETGTGKEVLAQSIHNASSRRGEPFVAVNCAALSDGLLESELFGYEEGAFTGARRGGKPGLFELAHGGTIFLDEIGETALHVQQRLLRVLEERRVMRIGGERVIPIDVRIIAATNKPLWTFALEGKFRQDLFFRLDVLRLNTVPLRERPEDIPDIFNLLLKQMWYHRKGVGSRPRAVSEVYQLLCRYDWPGNVRELRNMVDYLIAMSTGEVDTELVEEWFLNKSLSTLHPDTTVQTAASSALQVVPAGRTLEEVERAYVVEVLDDCDGNIQRTAEQLGISRTTLWRKLKQWRLES